MENKYSNGPWEWWSDNVLWSVPDNDSVLESDDDGKPYGSHAALISHHWDKDVKEANKRLIAAAPELLEALIEVVRISDRKHDAWDAAKDAIAKAIGECVENSL